MENNKTLIKQELDTMRDYLLQKKQAVWIKTMDLQIVHEVDVPALEKIKAEQDERKLTGEQIDTMQQGIQMKLFQTTSDLNEAKMSIPIIEKRIDFLEKMLDGELGEIGEEQPTLEEVKRRNGVIYD